jgi:hypothetical protein
MSVAEELLLSEWRTADRQARLLEHSIAVAWMAVLDGTGEPPPPEEIAAVHRLREVANDLFKVAMTEMAARPAELRPTQEG